jgi:hypothetical protein
VSPVTQQVRLCRDVDTSVGIVPEGLRMAATPADDGGWLLHLSLPGRQGQMHTEYVPAEWVTPC